MFMWIKDMQRIPELTDNNCSHNDIVNTNREYHSGSDYYIEDDTERGRQ